MLMDMSLFFRGGCTLEDNKPCRYSIIKYFFVSYWRESCAEGAGCPLLDTDSEGIPDILWVNDAKPFALAGLLNSLSC